MCVCGESRSSGSSSLSPSFAQNILGSKCELHPECRLSFGFAGTRPQREMTPVLLCSQAVALTPGLR